MAIDLTLTQIERDQTKLQVLAQTMQLIQMEGPRLEAAIKAAQTLLVTQRAQLEAAKNPLPNPA